MKRMIGFQKIFLKKGESKVVEFTITEDDLKFYNNNLQRVSEPGEFTVFIGTSSDNVKSTKLVLK